LVFVFLLAQTNLRLRGKHATQKASEKKETRRE